MKFVHRLIARLRPNKRLSGKDNSWQFVHPAREWATCLSITFVLAVALCGYAAFDFYSQMHDKNEPVLSEVSTPKYRSADAELIIRYYEGRARTFNALRENRPVQPLPTIEEMDEESSESEEAVAPEDVPE